MRRWVIVLLVALTALVVIAAAAVALVGGGFLPAVAPTAEPTASATAEPEIVAPEITVLPGTPSPAGIPLATPGTKVETWTAYRIQIPDIGVDASVIGVGLDASGAMAAPQNPFVIGWYSSVDAAKPGSDGNALLSGHLDYTDRITGRPGAGVFWRLSEIRQGAKVHIIEGSKRYSYTVTEAKWFAFNDRAALAYLNPNLGARLTLITCGGQWDPKTLNYSQRLLVIASMDAGASG